MTKLKKNMWDIPKSLDMVKRVYYFKWKQILYKNIYKCSIYFFLYWHCWTIETYIGQLFIETNCITVVAGRANRKEKRNKFCSLVMLHLHHSMNHRYDTIIGILFFIICKIQIKYLSFIIKIIHWQNLYSLVSNMKHVTIQSLPKFSGFILHHKTPLHPRLWRLLAFAWIVLLWHLYIFCRGIYLSYLLHFFNFCSSHPLSYVGFSRSRSWDEI